MTSFYLSSSFIRVLNHDTIDDFLSEIDSIPNINKYFKYEYVSDDIENNRLYEITDVYSGSDPDEEIGVVKEVVQNLIKVCDKHFNQANLTIKIFGHNDFDLYLIVIDNQLKDITDRVRQLLFKEEKKADEELSIR